MQKLYLFLVDILVLIDDNKIFLQHLVPLDNTIQHRYELGL